MSSTKASALKILPKKEIRTYELTILVPANLTSDELETTQTELRELLKKHKVDISEEIDWGKKYLAYTIKHNGTRYTEAQYLHWITTAAPKQLAKFEFELQHFPRVIRHLLIVADTKKEVPAEEKKAA